MRHPAALPALSVLAGALIGSQLAPRYATSLAVGVTACWTIAAAAYTSARVRLFVPAVAAAFAAASALVSLRAEDSAVHPSLRTLLEQQGRLSYPSIGGDDTGGPVIVEGVLREDAARTARGVSLSVRADHVVLDGRARDGSGGLLVSAAGPLAAMRAPQLTAGRRIRFPALIRRPAHYLDKGVRDEDVALARRGTALVGSIKSGALIDILDRGNTGAELAAAARRGARSAIDRGVGRWSARSAAVVAAILIGDRTGLEPDVERRLQEAGTYHVIAISGGNIAILAGLLVGSVRLAGVTGRWTSAASIALLLAYAGIVGGGSSVARATLMAVLYLSARIGDHRSPALNVIAMTAGLILCAAPLQIFDAGFALTFGATIAIVAGAAPLRRRIGGPRWLAPALGLFAASLCAEAVLFPVSAVTFSRVTFAGLLLNFIAIPCMALAQMAGMAVLAVAALHAKSAGIPGYAAHVGAWGLVESARLVEWAPWLTYRIPPPAPTAVAAYYCALMSWLICRHRVSVIGSADRRARTGCRVSTAAAVLAAIWILTAPTVARWDADKLTVVFFDVGQGDAAFIRFPNGRSLSVDTGGVGSAGTFDVGARVLTPALWWLSVRRIDYLAITHADPDHIGGAIAIVKQFRPLEVWEGVPVPRNEPALALHAAADPLGTAWRTLQTGDRLQIGGASVHVWHPPPPDWERQRVRNDDSLVIEIRYGAVSFLLTGDIGRDVERAIAPRLDAAALRIMKVPHHGSATSSSAEFIAAARPAIAVFSSGRGNRFGHPVPAVVQRYREAGAAIFRTDQDGAVTVETDGRSVTVNTFIGRRWSMATKPGGR